MELHNLKWSDNIRFSVTNIDDYNVKGTFDPNASCDTEYFGYRETRFSVSSVEIRLTNDLWVEDTTDLSDEFLTYYDDQVTLIVQNALDDKQGGL